MDLENDIKKFKNLGYKALNEQLKDLEEEIRIKRYFFNVLNILDEIDNLIKNNILENYGIKSLKLEQKYRKDIGETFAEIEILDEKGESIPSFTTVNEKHNCISFLNSTCIIHPGYEIIIGLLSRDNLILEKGLYNSEINKKTLNIPLNENTKNILKTYLFNDSLLKAYNYMDMLDKNPPKNNKEKISNRKI